MTRFVSLVLTATVLGHVAGGMYPTSIGLSIGSAKRTWLQFMLLDEPCRYFSHKTLSSFIDD
jgi:hypothetical protein